jgi:hypothetical protein
LGSVSARFFRVIRVPFIAFLKIFVFSCFWINDIGLQYLLLQFYIIYQQYKIIDPDCSRLDNNPPKLIMVTFSDMGCEMAILSSHLFLSTFFEFFKDIPGCTYRYHRTAQGTKNHSPVLHFQFLQNLSVLLFSLWVGNLHKATGKLRTVAVTGYFQGVTASHVLQQNPPPSCKRWFVKGLCPIPISRLCIGIYIFHIHDSTPGQLAAIIQMKK